MTVTKKQQCPALGALSLANGSRRAGRFTSSNAQGFAPGRGGNGARHCAGSGRAVEVVTLATSSRQAPAPTLRASHLVEVVTVPGIAPDRAGRSRW